MAMAMTVPTCASSSVEVEKIQEGIRRTNVPFIIRLNFHIVTTFRVGIGWKGRVTEKGEFGFCENFVRAVFAGRCTTR